MSWRKLISSHPVAAALVVTGICLLPVVASRDFTPANELRYLSIVDEAMEEGSLFAFYNQGQPYTDKPPLYFWLMMLCKALAGHHSIFLLSLLSIMPAFATIGVFDRWVYGGRKDVNPVERGAVALLLGTCGMFLGATIVLRMDMLMTLFIVLALRSFFVMYEKPSRRKVESWLLPLWIFLALFSKGPVGLLMPPLVIAVFLAVKKDWKGIWKYAGGKTLAVIAVLAGAWFLCVYLDGGKEYLGDLVFHQTFDRAVHAFHHKEPFWWYAWVIWMDVAPYCVLLVPAIVASWLGKPSAGTVRSDKEIFFGIAIAATFLMLSCFSSKLPVYLLPIVPFCVYMFPLLAQRIGWKPWMYVLLTVSTSAIALAALAFLTGLAFLKDIPAVARLTGEYPFVLSPFIRVGVVLLFAFSAAAVAYSWKREGWLSWISLSVGILLFVCSSGFGMKDINPYIGYGSLCKEIPRDVRVVTLYVQRPENMDAYLGRDIAKDYGRDPEAFLAAEPAGTGPAMLVVKTSRLDAAPRLREFIGKQSRAVSSVGPYTLVLYE